MLFRSGSQKRCRSTDGVARGGRGEHFGGGGGGEVGAVWWW